MCAEYNMGGGGETEKGSHKSSAFLFPFGVEWGTTHGEYLTCNESHSVYC